MNPTIKIDNLIFPAETYEIVGASMTVLNTIGCGFYEKSYENALVVELGFKKIPIKQQPRFPIIYKGITVGEYIPDLIAFDCIIVDTKVIDSIGDHEIGQMLNYLRITGLKLGLIVNFKHSQLEWIRVTL